MNRKNIFAFTVCILSASALIGCGSKKETAETAGTITGYLVDNAEKYVKIGNYQGLEVERPVYTVSEDSINLQIESLQYENAVMTDLDRPAEYGDVVIADILATIQGEGENALSEKDYVVELGYEEFGQEFDEQLIGAQPGDQKTFSCSFDEDTWYEDWIGKTLDFEVTVNKVQTTSLPDYDDAFVKQLGYSSKEELEEALEEELAKNYEEQSAAEFRENILTEVMETCEFQGYPDKLYDSCKSAVKERYASFASMLGMSEEELYEAYEMTEEDMEDEIISTVNRHLFVSALCEKENVQVTDSEYTSYLTEQADAMGYETPEALEEDYGKEDLMWSLYEDRLAEILQDQIEPVDAEYDEEDGINLEDAFAIDEDMETLDGFEISTEIWDEDFEEET